MHTAFLSTTDICTGAPSSFTPSIKKWRHKNFLKDNNNYNKTNNKKKQKEKESDEKTLPTTKFPPQSIKLHLSHDKNEREGKEPGCLCFLLFLDTLEALWFYGDEAIYVSR